MLPVHDSWVHGPVQSSPQSDQKAMRERSGDQAPCISMTVGESVRRTDPQVAMSTAQSSHTPEEYSHWPTAALPAGALVHPRTSTWRQSGDQPWTCFTSPSSVMRLVTLPFGSTMLSSVSSLIKDTSVMSAITSSTGDHVTPSPLIESAM
jgi:hypothetical protein